MDGPEEPFLHAEGKGSVTWQWIRASVAVAICPDVSLNKPKLVSSFNCVCSSRAQSRPVNLCFGSIVLLQSEFLQAALTVALILWRRRSLFSALYQFFMCSHLSSGDGCHPAAGCRVFSRPCGADISWTLTDEEGTTRLGLLFTNLV